MFQIRGGFREMYARRDYGQASSDRSPLVLGPELSFGYTWQSPQQGFSLALGFAVGTRWAILAPEAAVSMVIADEAGTVFAGGRLSVRLGILSSFLGVDTSAQFLVSSATARVEYQIIVYLDLVNLVWAFSHAWDGPLS